MANLTIPDGAKAEAKRGLAWRKEFGRGGTEVGMASARRLAQGGEATAEFARKVAKYFPRHEVDKKGQGWSPGEDGYPSAGRIAWALWGGDPARRWAEAAVKSLDNAEKGDLEVSMKLFAEISKVDDEKRMVYGYASTEALDNQGEKVSKDALARALPDYMKFANIREMHQPSAVGVAKQANIDDKGMYLAAKVVDDTAWKKVKEGVYKGFSIGGRSVSKVDNMITDLRLTEISLVDRPANPEAVIEVWKADDGKTAQERAVEELAKMLDAGSISPERLVELAKGESTKADTAEKPVDGIDLQKYLGAEAYDAACAIRALGEVYMLLERESGEGENFPDQIEALKAVVARLKDFIASEIMEPMEMEEGEAPEIEVETEEEEGEKGMKGMKAEDEEKTYAEGSEEEMVEMADKITTLAKAGRTISAKTMNKLQAMHDAVAALGAKCSKMDEEADDKPAQEDASEQDKEKADSEGDVAKADAVLKKVADLEATINKMVAQNEKLSSELDRIKAMPQPGKALLKAIAKGDDMIVENQKADGPKVVGADGKENEAASLIKMIHQQGGVR